MQGSLHRLGRVGTAILFNALNQCFWDRCLYTIVYNLIFNANTQWGYFKKWVVRPNRHRIGSTCPKSMDPCKQPEPLSENQYSVFRGMRTACLVCAGGHTWHRTALFCTCWTHSRWRLWSQKAVEHTRRSFTSCGWENKSYIDQPASEFNSRI